MEATQIREMKSEDRTVELEKLERELFTLRTRAETEKLENTHLLRNIKRDIARYKTIIRQSQLKA
ncbi:MAG: 50S ribosomal protein L29 [Planctomycetaceae bacterium]|nr:50S ribosomal protein L29 [Planctomycetaceae bacterium]